MAIDYDSDTGRVRILIPDTNEAALLFSDVQIDAFLDLEGGVKKAAALALETAASSEAMVSKVIRTQDASTDGAKVSDALLARAARLREQAAADEDDAADGGGLDIVDFRDPWSRRRGAEAAEWRGW